MKKLIAFVFVTVVAAQAIANDYIRNIKIGFKNLDGVERVIVEQLDEGYHMPGKFEVNDFQKGYFTAQVDIEFYSWFRIIGYRKDGTAHIEYVTIAPLEPVEQEFEEEVLDGQIHIQSTRLRNTPRELLTSYEIVPADNTSSHPLMSDAIENDEVTVSIGSLPEGTYVLNYYDVMDRKHSVTFRKK